MFDAIARRYDFLNHLLSAGIDRQWRRRAIVALRLSGGERVLDLCTGTADLAIAACSAVPRAARAVGLDFSGAMLAVAAEKVARLRFEHAVSLVQSDATRLPIGDASIDCVTVAFGIRNLDRPEVACAEMHRVLRSGGRLAVLEFAIPDTALLRGAYLAYFRHVLPWIGRLVSRDHGAYRYLPASVVAFATPDEFVRILESCGFTQIQADPLTFGIVYLYTARVEHDG